ncbi:MAG: lamin tail domain-containing protein, partial [Myxococcales bacterium]|nr:lamin tail domain-containing protein [Myxococcales bacterium]
MVKKRTDSATKTTSVHHSRHLVQVCTLRKAITQRMRLLSDRVTVRPNVGIGLSILDKTVEFACTTFGLKHPITQGNIMRHSTNNQGAVQNFSTAGKICPFNNAFERQRMRGTAISICSAILLFVLLVSSRADAKCLTPPGDIDLSGVTNVADVQCGILMSLWELGGKITPLPICLKSQVVDADLNCDGFTNVADVVISIFLALKQPLSPDLDADGDGCADICSFDTDGDGEPNLTDCAPFEATIYPGAPESCNGLDDDCDGAKDEEVGINAVLCTNNDVCDGVETCGGYVPAISLVITEIMINPGDLAATDDGTREFIEIYNGGSTVVDLRNWTLKDLIGQTHKVTSNAAILVQPGGYVVLGRDTDLLLNGSIYVDYVYSGITFANDSDSLLLLNPADVEIDRVVYSAGGGWTIPTGASIGLTSPTLNNNIPSSWQAATTSWQPEIPPTADPPTPGSPASDFGTPGGPTIAFPSLCLFEPALDCDDNNLCTTDSCDPIVGCVNTDITATCDDGNVCTDNSCEPLVGCVYTDNTAPCTDGSGCTVNDTCSGGACIAGAAPDCNDNLACTTDTCNSTGDTTYTCSSTLNATFCLISGVCYSDTDGNPANQCQLCDSDNDTGDWTNRINGFSCNADSSGCTVNDSCLNGTCVAGPAPNCSDGLTCTTDTCSSTGDSSYSCVNTLNSGNCLIGGVCYSDNDENPGNECQICDSGTDSADWTNKSTGTACNADGSGCTVADFCNSGTCTPGAAPDCSDGLTCTTDTCTSTGDTTYSCGSTLDANFCLISGVCYADTDGNPANQCQVCDSGTDSADWTNRIDGFSCNADSSGCTVNDSCSAGVCTAGPAPNCDDNLTCTTDSCSSTGNTSYACINALVAGSCLIGGVCYSDNDENPINECQLCDSGTEPEDWTNKSTGTSCNADSSGCTVDDVCTGGTCTAGSAPDCSDGLNCTTDTCVSTGTNTYSCSNILVANVCEIGGVCYPDGDPNPANQCQVCDSDADPSDWTNRIDGFSCNADSDGCTVNDSCSAGTCTAGP